MVGRNGDDRFRVEVDGENALPIFKTVSDIIEKNDDITKVVIEVESEEPLTLSDYTEDLYKTGVGCESDDSDIIGFCEESESFHLAQCMATSVDKWYNTAEIKRAVHETDDYNIPQNRISQILWDLSERGVLKKRPCKSNRRMKEYNITEKGIRSVEAAE